MKEEDTVELTRRGAYAMKFQNNPLIQAGASQWRMGYGR